MNREDLADAFQRFAEHECHERSPLYEQICLAIAEDAEILALAAECRSNQPAPNLLLAAVQFLVLRGAPSELAAYYPTLGGEGLPKRPVYPAFRQFCLQYASEIRPILKTRRVQTNEVGRCAYFLPAFTFAAELVNRPLALIELGSSAGLLLNWDRYGYRYVSEGPRDEILSGDASSPVQICALLRGEKIPPLSSRTSMVASRIGIDIHPIDICNRDEVLWLRALIWPEHTDRAALLNAAIKIAQVHAPSVIAGDALVMLPDLIRQIPAAAIPCVFHSHTLNQLTKEQRGRLAAIFNDCGKERALLRIGAEGGMNPPSQLRLYHWNPGEARQMLLAQCEGHGRWIEWLM